VRWKKRFDFGKLSRVQAENVTSPELNRPRTSALRPITPDNPPWNTPIAIAAWLMSILAIIVVPGLFLFPYLMSRGPAIREQQAIGEFLRNDPGAMLVQVIAIVPAHLITLAIAWAVVTKFNRFSFRETLGWNSGGIKWWHYAAILGAFFLVAGVVGSYFPEQENELTRLLKSSRAAVFLVAFMATFTAPIVEEVIYRGIVYSAFQRTMGVAAAIIAVTLLFALVHVPQYYPSFSTIGLLLLLSLILTLVRVGTGNLWPCIVLHTIFNGTQSILLILEPYLKTAAPVIDPTTSTILK